MPVYDYQCKRCGHVFEEVHDIHVRLRRCICPQCDEWVALKRLIGHSTFILKGDCWEHDGYQKKLTHKQKLGETKCTEK